MSPFAEYSNRKSGSRNRQRSILGIALASFSAGMALLLVTGPALEPIELDSVALADPAYNHGSLTFEDPDRDGLPSALEFILGTDSLVFDSDGDGFDDGLETAVGTDPLIENASIPDRSNLKVEFFPIPDNRVGILFLCYGRHGIGVIQRFRVLAGRGETYENQTSELFERGVRLASANPTVASIALTTPLESIGRRLNVIAEYVEDGRLVSETRAIGVHANEVFIQDFFESAPGEMTGRYHLLGNRPWVLVPGIGSNWGPATNGSGGGTSFLDDHVFTERIIRVRHKGLILDTVVENRCDPDPGERCPTDLSTVGEVRTGPSR